VLPMGAQISAEGAGEPGGEGEKGRERGKGEREGREGGRCRGQSIAARERGRLGLGIGATWAVQVNSRITRSTDRDCRAESAAEFSLLNLCGHGNPVGLGFACVGQSGAEQSRAHELPAASAYEYEYPYWSPRRFEHESDSGTGLLRG